jgi:LysM repeat protein
VRWQDIAAANNLTSRSIIRPGQRLLVPMAPSAVLASRATWESGAEVVYRVKRGDTLSRIARLHDTSVASIKTWNNLTSDRINVGDLLSLFPPRTR